MTDNKKPESNRSANVPEPPPPRPDPNLTTFIERADPPDDPSEKG